MTPWAQIIFLALICIDFGLVAMQHGKPREPYNFWTWIFATAI